MRFCGGCVRGKTTSSRFFHVRRPSPLPIITNDNIDDYYDPSMTVQSTCFANGKDRHLVTDAYYDQFFTGGEKAPTLTP